MISESQLNLLLLSPHRDDVAFSISASVKQWLNAGHRVTLLNVFTRSTYAPFADLSAVSFDNVLSHVTLLRKHEDQAFLRATPGLAMIDLDLEDAPVRLRCDASSVCDQQALVDDPIVLTIQAAIEHEVYSRAKTNLFTHPDSTALVVPLGLGCHVDHVLVRNAALHFLHRIPIAFYEEVPYVMRESAADDFQRFVKQLSIPLAPTFTYSEPTTHTKELQRRLDLVRIYRSQINAQEARAIASFPQRSGDTERLWVNPAWLATTLLASRAAPPTHMSLSEELMA